MRTVATLIVMLASLACAATYIGDAAMQVVHTAKVAQQHRNHCDDSTSEGSCY